MKEQKKSTSKVIVRSALILLLLTLISGCFLGSTFARYVSKGEGDLSAGVAKWDVSNTLEGEDNATVDIGDFSPNMAKYDSSKDRTRSVKVTLLSITNSGAVDAYVKVTIGEAVTLYDAENQIINLDAVNRGDGVGYYAPQSGEINSIFDLTNVEYKIDDATATAVSATSTEYDGMYLLEDGKTLAVTATVTWTTDLTSDTDIIYTTVDEIGCVFADYRDTWIGKNVVNIGWTYSWYALQGSETPADGDGVTEDPTTTAPGQS